MEKDGFEETTTLTGGGRHSDHHHDDEDVVRVIVSQGVPEKNDTMMAEGACYHEGSVYMDGEEVRMILQNRTQIFQIRDII